MEHFSKCSFLSLKDLSTSKSIEAIICANVEDLDISLFIKFLDNVIL